MRAGKRTGGRGRRGVGSRSYTSSSLSHHSRLPDLPYTPSTSTMSTTSQISWPSTFVEDAGDDEDDKDSVVPLVPGCGLPSVQHARGEGATAFFHPRVASPATPDSYNDSDNSTSSPTPPLDFPEPYPRVPAIRKSKTPLRPVSKCSTKAPRRPTSGVHTSKPNRLTALNRSNNTNKIAPQKRRSKVSITSDSGISSFSNSSENSESYLENERAGTRTNPKFSPSKSDFAEEEEDEEEEDRGSVVGRSTHKNKKSVSHVTFSKATLHHYQRHHSHHHDPHQARSLSRGSAPSYPRPWRERGGVPTTGGKLAPPRQLPDRVGDFFLVWPFNESSRKCSNSDLDPRVVIKECQRLFRDRMTHFSTGATSGAWTAPKVPMLWGPLKVDPNAAH